MKEAPPNIYHRPALAVGDAMMVSMNFLVNSYITENDIRLASSRDMDEIFEKSLDRKCGKSSINSLYFLTKNYHHLFDRMTLIGTYKETNSKYRRVHPLRNTSWRYHAYFLVKDSTGLYYAGSPANYSPDKPEYLKPIISEDLDLVLKQIVKRDGGSWPSKSSIERVFESSYTPPSITFRHDLDKTVFTFTQIQRTSRGDEFLRASSIIDFP